MKTSLLITAAAALALVGCNKSTRSADTTVPNDTAANTAQTANGTSVSGNATAAADSVSNDLRGAANSASNAIGSAATNVATSARITQWKLNSSDIQADLENDRDIVRTKDENAGAAVSTKDTSVVESMVKGRLEADSDIAALDLKVDADKNGEVTLKGKAHNAEEVGRAIALALDTDGVSKVTSKIKLDNK